MFKLDPNSVFCMNSTIETVARAVARQDTSLAQTAFNNSELVRSLIRIEGTRVALVNPTDFSALVASARLARINDKKRDIDSKFDEIISTANTKTRQLSCLDRQARLWNFKGARCHLAGIRLSDGSTIHTPSSVADALREKWAPTFTAESAASPEAKQFLDEWAANFDFSDIPPPCRSDYKKVISRLVDKTTGPDGFPNSAWRAAEEEGVESLYLAGNELAGGKKPPRWLQL